MRAGRAGKLNKASDGPAGLPPFRRRLSSPPLRALAVAGLLICGLSVPARLAAQLQPETWRVLVLRVDFSYESTDEPSTSGRGRFDLRSIGEAIGDMRLPFDGPPHDRAFYEQHMEALGHYYDVVSEGRVQIEAEVFPRVDTLAYTLPGTILEYANGRTPEEIGQLWWKLIADAAALADADPDGPEFSAYDSYLFIHAGLGFETGQLNDIRSVFLSAHDLDSYGDPIHVDAGATTIREAWVLPEVVVANGRAGLNGILAKFFGHQLGLPGLSNFVDGLPALGGWSLMDVGANRVGFLLWNGVVEPIFGFVPPHPMAWSKARLGWIEPLVVERDTTLSILAGDRSAQDHPGAVKAARIQLSPMEYLLVSNRQQRGRPEFVLPEGALSFDVETSWIDTDEVVFARQITADQIDTLVGRGTGPLIRIRDDAYDHFAPSSGILVWHIDSTVFVETPEFFNSERTRPAVMLHEADGERDIGNAFFDRQDRTEGNRADAYFAGQGIDSEPGVTRFGPDTHPSSRTHTGFDSGVEIEVLDEIADVMRVSIRFNHSAAGWPAGSFETTELSLVGESGTDPPLILSGNDRQTTALGTRGQLRRQWDGRLLASGDGVVFLQGAGVVTGYASDSDESLWATEAQAEAALVAALGTSTDPVIVLAETNAVQILDASTGAILASHEMAVSAMAAADLTGDGRLGLVLATDSGLYGLGSPDAGGTPALLGAAGEALIDVFSGDLTGDGIDELVAVSATGGLWLHDGRQLNRVGELGESPVGRGALGDVDGDGKLEIVVQSSRQVYVFEVSNLTTPLLTAAGFPVQPPDHHEVAALIGGPILADLNADGAQEILLSTTIGLYAYDASGQIMPGFPLPTMRQPTSSPLAADVDGDGRVDVLVPTQRGVQRFEPGRAGTGASFIAWSQAGGDASQLNRHLLSPVVQPPTTPALLPAGRAYCYPNPVSSQDPSAHVRFHLADDATVKLDIYDAIGDRIDRMHAELAGGVEHELSWSVSDYASGLYLCRLQATAQGRKSEVTLRLAVSQ